MLTTRNRRNLDSIPHTYPLTNDKGMPTFDISASSILHSYSSSGACCCWFSGRAKQPWLLGRLLLLLLLLLLLMLLLLLSDVACIDVLKLGIDILFCTTSVYNVTSAWTSKTWYNVPPLPIPNRLMHLCSRAATNTVCLLLSPPAPSSLLLLLDLPLRSLSLSVPVCCCCCCCCCCGCGSCSCCCCCCCWLGQPPAATHPFWAQTIRHINHRHGPTERQTDWPTERQTDRQIERETDRQTDRQTDSQTDRQTDTDKETERNV